MKYCMVVLFAAAVAVWAQSAGQALTYRTDTTAFRGYLARGKAPAERVPGVLVLHEWWGLNDPIRQITDRLAARGFIALAADMYGNGFTTSDPSVAKKMSGSILADTTLLRKRARAALDTLRRIRGVDSNRVAIIGFCFGGTAALHLAYSGIDAKGIVSFHGGLPLPGPESDRIRTRMLIQQGTQDPFVSDSIRQSFLKAMDATSVDYQMVLFGHAQHAFTNPQAGEYKLKGIAYDQNAATRSWNYMLAFFHEIFAVR